MRNNDNLPVMNWDGDNSALHARVQILNGEPLILAMGGGFVINMTTGASCGCRSVDEGKHFVDCDPQCVLTKLAGDNNLPALATLGAAVAQAGMLIDLEPARSHIIIYD